MSTLDERKQRAEEHWEEGKEGCYWAIADGDGLSASSIAFAEDEAWRRWRDGWKQVGITGDDLHRLQRGERAIRIIITKVDD